MPEHSMADRGGGVIYWWYISSGLYIDMQLGIGWPPWLTGLGWIIYAASSLGSFDLWLGLGYIHIHGKIVIARLGDRCVLESSNGVAADARQYPDQLLPHHTLSLGWLL